MSDLSISKSVGRAFQVLEYFRDSREPCTTRDLEKALSYPYSSIRAIVKNLENLGYLICDGKSRAYFPTQKLFRLGEWVQGNLWDSTGLADVVDDIGARTHESAALVSRNFIFSNFLRVHNSAEPMSFRHPIGVGLLLTNSAVGRVVLSQMSDKEADRLINYTKYWTGMAGGSPMAEIGDVKADIKKVREQGSLSAYNLWLKGIGTVAFPIPGQVAKAPLAISVSGPAERIRKNEPAIRKAIESALQGFGK